MMDGYGWSALGLIVLIATVILVLPWIFPLDAPSPDCRWDCRWQKPYDALCPSCSLRLMDTLEDCLNLMEENMRYRFTWNYSIRSEQ